MPLSKKRNRDRMRDTRLHTKIEKVFVQPNTVSPSFRREGYGKVSTILIPVQPSVQPEIDADGNVIPGMEE